MAICGGYFFAWTGLLPLHTRYRSLPVRQQPVSIREEFPAGRRYQVPGTEHLRPVRSQV